MDEQRVKRNQVLVFRKIDAVLSVLAAASTALGLTEIAKRAGLSKATTHRLLVTMAQFGYVDPGDRDGAYRLGIRLFQLGSVVQRGFDLRQRALPAMRRLADATEETVFLCIQRDRDALCLDRIDGKHVQSLVLQIGTTLPLYVGAASRVLLAAMSDDDVETVIGGSMTEWTRHTETRLEAMREIVAQIRAQGYAISEEDVTLGVAAIGAPVRGAHGEVIAALSLSGVVQRLTRDRLPSLVSSVVETAREISIAMGCPASALRAAKEALSGARIR